MIFIKKKDETTERELQWTAATEYFQEQFEFLQLQF